MKDLYNINDWTDVQDNLKLGEILLQSGKINLIHLGMALDIQRFQKMPLGQIFLEMKVIKNQDLQAALDLQKEINQMIENREQNNV